MAYRDADFGLIQKEADNSRSVSQSSFSVRRSGSPVRCRGSPPDLGSGKTRFQIAASRSIFAAHMKPGAVLLVLNLMWRMSHWRRKRSRFEALPTSPHAKRRMYSFRRLSKSRWWSAWSAKPRNPADLRNSSSELKCSQVRSKMPRVLRVTSRAQSSG